MTTSIDFNPRSSCEERPGCNAGNDCYSQISIHAPHARSDGYTPVEATKEMIFQSTLLMRGATLDRRQGQRSRADFNPRSSCEERRADGSKAASLAGFQSTLLMRGATITLLMLGLCQQISIHAPHARSDFSSIEAAQGMTISIHAPHARSDTTRRT